MFCLAQSTPNERKDLLTELHLMKKLKPHKHVIKLLACVTTSGEHLLLTVVFLINKDSVPSATSVKHVDTGYP